MVQGQGEVESVTVHGQGEGVTEQGENEGATDQGEGVREQNGLGLHETKH